MEKVRLIIEEFSNEVILALIVCVLILFVLLFITMINLSLYKSKRKSLNSSKANLSYDDHIINNKKEIDFMKKLQSDILAHIDILESRVESSFSKVNLYRYNALERLGGQLSFIFIMLNEQDCGVILHNVHNDDFTYVYAKQVIDGKTEEVLTREEQEQLALTIKQKK